MNRHSVLLLGTELRTSKDDLCLSSSLTRAWFHNSSLHNFRDGIPEGSDIELIEFSLLEYKEEQTKLVKLLERLTGDERVPLENIVLLTPSNKQKSRFRDGSFADGRYWLSWGSYTEIKRDNTLTCSTIHGFKGLESDVVIVAELDKLKRMRESDKLMYVALSRARLHLIILGDSGNISSMPTFSLDYLLEHPF